MSEDRLDKAIEEMRNESVSPEELAQVRERVWTRMGTPGLVACMEVRPGLRDYVDGRLAGSRRTLVEDHLSRCAQCRAELSGLKGDRKVIAMPERRLSWWPRAGTWAAAAALVLMALYLGRDRIDTLLAPSGPRASLAEVSGGVYRVPVGALQVGTSLGQGEVVRTGPGSRAVFRLADGSRVEMNERSELFVNAAWSGQTIHLERGDIIVQAAKQHRGHLRVQTRDSVASVKGTVFAVSAGLAGTVVSVVEGSVGVTQPGVDVVLKPGEQAATNRALRQTVQEAVAWSPDAGMYLELLASVAKLEKDIAKLPSPALRTEPLLLQYLPADAVVYGAVPNIGGTIGQAMVLAEQQSAESPAFRDWWNSTAGLELKQLVDRVQTVTPLLGDELVFVFAKGATIAGDGIPMVAASVLDGKHAELAAALEALPGEAGGGALPFNLSATTMIVSDSQEHLQWLLGHLGDGASSPFASAIAERYQRGVGWLVGMDIEPMVSIATDAAAAAFTGVQQMRYLFLEQRDILGAEENEVTLTFKGPRMGMASWLASGGSGGAAEYLPSEAIFAIYASTREPRQLFDELLAQLTASNPSSGGVLTEAESKLGAGFAGDLASAFGTESAFAVEGLSATGPVWVLAVLVNNQETVDYSIRKLVDVFNADLPAGEEEAQIVLEQQVVDGRTWTTMKSGKLPFTFNWTFDRGYMVAASDRAVAMRAIATCDAGSGLVRSAAFQQQLPSSVGLHPSAFAWLNTKGAFDIFAAFVSNTTIQKLMAERDPILVVFSGTTEQIHSASRTRLSGLVVDTMLLESLSRARVGTQAPTLQQGKPGMR